MSNGIKRKVRLALNLYETTNENRLKTGGSLTASIYPGGVQIETSTTIPASPSTINIACSGRGAIEAPAVVAIVRQSGGVWNRIDTGGEIISVSGIAENGAAPGEFLFTLTDTSANTLDVQIGDRIVALPSAYETLYEDESEDSDTLTNPIDVPTGGVVEFYVEATSVDVYLAGDSITDGYYAFNVASAGSGIGPLRLRTEEAAASASNVLAIDADVGIVRVTDATNAIAEIEHASPERVLIIYPTVSGVQLDTASAKADNTIYEASPQTITLTADVPVILVAHEGASADISYWTIVGTPTLVDLNLDDIGDVSSSSPTTGRPLVWNGSAWVDSTGIGTLAAPLATIYVTDTGLFLSNGSFEATLDAVALTADRIFTFPDQAGEIVVTGGTQNVPGRKVFDDGILTGLRIKSVSGTDRVASFDASGITNSTNRLFTFPDKAGTFAMTSDLVTAMTGLSDTNISGPVEGDALVYDGTDWANSDTIGTSTNPMNQVFVEADGAGGGLHIMAGSGPFDGQLDAVAITAARSWSLPDADGEVLISSAAVMTVTRSFWFDDGVAAAGLFDQLVNRQNASLFMRVPSALESIVLVEVLYEWNLSAASAAATPTTLNLYKFSAYTPGTAVPPTGGTAILSSNIPVPSVGQLGSSGTTASFVSSTVAGGDYIAIGIAANNNEPGVAGELIISLNYIIWEQ